jgi:hypothetical protein
MREFQVAIEANDWAHEYLKTSIINQLEVVFCCPIEDNYWGRKDRMLYCSSFIEDTWEIEDWNDESQGEEGIAYFLGDLSNAPFVYKCLAITDIFPKRISFWSSTFEEIAKFQHHEVDCEAMPRFPIFYQTADTPKDENDPCKAD